MSLVDKIGLGLLGRLEPERAHAVALRALHGPLVSLPGPATSPVLKTRLVGLELPNPVGLAAGFDKNATALAPLMRAGFGFVEVGAATPRPQRGNPRPRVFRLRRDRAVINRMGFPNDGVDAIVERLAARPKGIPVGLNIGAGKDSPDRARDYAEVLERARPHIDFATVNVSSPNTERLRDLQGRQALAELLAGVMAVRGDVPVFLKIAPDLTDAEVTDIASVALETGVEGLIATNTTVSRGPLRGRRKGEAGGLSGQPLFEPSTRTLARLYRDTGGVIPIIGVGGVSTGREAYEKIRAGASAVQLYTAMVYDGLGVVGRIARDLDILLQHDGFESVEAARGSGVRAWLT